MSKQQAEQIIELLFQCLGELRSLAQASEAAKPFRSHLKPIEQFPGFDWGSIGATVVAADDDGPTVVEFGGESYKRRSPQNKFTPAIWYSRSIGKDEGGENQYQKLITFKDLSTEEVDPIPAKVRGLVEVGPRPVLVAPAATPTSMGAKLYIKKLKDLFKRYGMAPDDQIAIARKHHPEGMKDIRTSQLDAAVLERVYYAVEDELQREANKASDEF